MVTKSLKTLKHYIYIYTDPITALEFVKPEDDDFW